jgi:hypothetical protein
MHHPDRPDRPHHPDHPDYPDYRARCLLLESDNEYLRSELEEFQFRERNLRKELDIMAQIPQDPPQQGEREREREREELKAQVAALLLEKQQW